MRIEAPPTGQVNAVIELLPDYTEMVLAEPAAPRPPMGEARVYRVGVNAAGGISLYIVFIDR